MMILMINIESTVVLALVLMMLIVFLAVAKGEFGPEVDALQSTGHQHQTR